MKKILFILASLGVFFGTFLPTYAVSTFITQQGGTGTTSPSGILYGDNSATSHLNTVSIGSNLTFSGGTLSATAGGTFPFTPQTWGNSTSTVIGFTQGIITNASTTFAQLSTGAIYDQNGLILAHATTSASVANQDVWRDGNGNTLSNNFIPSLTSTVANGGTNVLTPASTRYQLLTGSNNQTFQMPNGNASGMNTGATWDFNNNTANGFLTQVTTHGGVSIVNVPFGGFARTILTDNSTSEGSWETHSYLGHNDVAGSYVFGVGSTSPFARFSIHANNGDPKTTLFAIGSSTASATTTLFSISNTGAVTTSLGTGCVNSTNGLLSVSGSGCTSGTVTSIATNNGITGGTITSSGTIGLATINAGVLGAVTNTTVPTSQATSTLYGTGVGGQVLGWNNVTGGIAWIATSTSGSTFPFTPTTNYGAAANSTSTPIWFTAGLQASTTANYFAGLTVDNALAGDALTQYGAANHEWVTGAKSSDFTFRISSSTTLGTNDVFEADKSLNVYFPHLTSNGFVKTSGGTGQLSIDTTVYDTFGQSLEIDSTGYLAATTTNKYGFSTAPQGTTYGYAIGDQLLAYASSTNLDTIFGLGAGGQISTTSATTDGTVAIGYQALKSYSSANKQNTAVGYQTLQSLTSGSNNTAVGWQALKANITSNYNTAVGYWALEKATGQGNTGLGFRALDGVTTGLNNTSIGYASGFNITTGYDNLFLGETQDVGGNAITTGGGNIGLGYNIVYPSTSQNLMLNIGNSIFGGLVATSTSTSLPTTMTGIWFGVATSSLTTTTFAVQNAASGNKIANLFSSTGTSRLFINDNGELVGTDAANSWTGRISPTHSFVLSTATTTTWTGTTTGAYIPQLAMPFAGTLQQVRCNATSTAAFLNIAPYIGTTQTTPGSFVASSTVGVEKFTANNTFSAGNVISMYVGTSTASTANLGVSCTFDITETP